MTYRTGFLRIEAETAESAMETDGHHQALSGADRLLAAIVASSDDAIISKTVDGIVTSWNRGAERIFGYSAKEMIGNPISILAVPGHEDEMPNILYRIRRNERVDHFETTRRHRNGSILNISLTVSPIHDDMGRVIGASKVARDITAARLAAEALQEAQDLINAQHRELLHASRLSELGQMAAVLAHEVNQPLSAIVNYLRAVQRLLDASDSANKSMIREAVHRSTEQALRASEIVHHLRDFAKPDGDELNAVPIADVLEKIASLATIDAAERGVHIRGGTDFPDCRVIANPVQIQQVVFNLIRNALDAMEGSRRRDLHLTVLPGCKTVEVNVADTGSGIDPSVRDRLCQPFLTTKTNGMGLGLSICQRIVTSHGGRLWAEDNPGGGTIFKFTLQSADAN